MTDIRRTGLNVGAVESFPKFVWRILMKLPDFKLFSDKSARIVFIFPSNCQNFHGFLKLGRGVSRTPMTTDDLSCIAFRCVIIKNLHINDNVVSTKFV